ncbi:MAG TPA: cold shock domain-containing protein [Methylotenera sp.]|nr:cold shock domain-containing protein [Methylotenera sp.]
MRQEGKIIKWFDDKGYGFICPKDSNEQIFAHISAFPKLEKRPEIDEAVTYQIIKDTKKGFQAQNVLYINRPTSNKIQRGSKITNKKNHNLVFILSLAIFVTFIFLKDMSFTSNRLQASSSSIDATNSIEAHNGVDSHRYRCANKTSCSQMASCEEAKYYLNNCPGTIMDGDGDGLPCEDQWCGH